MASVNWLKLTTQKAGALKCHLGKEERVSVNHSNKDIDVSKSHLNLYVGCDDYADAYQSMRERTVASDAVLPPKRNAGDKRIVAFMLEAPCPMEIQEQGREKEFFESLHDTYKTFFGEDNVHGTFAHLDEQHEYVDHGKSVTSLYHAHTLVSAYTDDKGINGKAFSARERMIGLNKAVSDMVKARFGIDYNTGDTPRQMSVETLKAQSKREEAEKALADTESRLTERTEELLSVSCETPEKRFWERSADFEQRATVHQAANALKIREASVEQREKMVEQERQAVEQTGIEYRKAYKAQQEHHEKAMAYLRNEHQKFLYKVAEALKKQFGAFLTPKQKEIGVQTYLYRKSRIRRLRNKERGLTYDSGRSERTLHI